MKTVNMSNIMKSVNRAIGPTGLTDWDNQGKTRAHRNYTFTLFT